MIYSSGILTIVSGREIMKKLLLTIALLTIAIILAGCGSGGSSSSSVPQGVNPGIPSAISLLPTSYIAQTNALISLKAKVLDGNGSPVPGQTVFFTNLSFPFGAIAAASFGSSGINAASSQATAITNSQGIATALISSPTEGFATVLVQVGVGFTAVRDIRTVFFTASDSFNFSPIIILDVDSDGNGIFNEAADFVLLDSATDREVIVRATVLDGLGFAEAGAQVTFATDAPFRVGADPTATCSDGSTICEITFPSGNIATTNTFGETSVLIQITPATLRGLQTVLNVLADADNGAFNIVSLFLQPVTVSAVSVFANPNVVASGGTSQVTGSAVTNVGTPVPDGTVINFTATSGGIDPFAATTDGAATVAYTAPTLNPGDPDLGVTVNASVGSAVPGAASITVTAPAAAPATQTLNSFADISTAPAVPATVQMANIASTATNGGVALTSTQVSVGGTVALADVAAIRVLWNAAPVGNVTPPASLTNVNIPLAGAGLGNGTLTYEIDLLGTATGKDFDLTVTSVTGNTTDSIPLPSTTATQTAP
jgi:hypothetical protein